MALTNNTKFRRVDVTINKKVNGSLQTTGGFPKKHSITSAFGAFSSITEEALSIMTDADYTTRLNAFYAFLETTYSFFERSQMTNASSGIDPVLCPLSNAPAPSIVASGVPVLSFVPVQGGQLDVNLEWLVNVTEQVTQDVSYYFDANIRDKHGSLIRTERLYGIIRQGRSYHNSLADDGHYIYFPEAENSSQAPLEAEFVPGSLVFEV